MIKIDDKVFTEQVPSGAEDYITAGKQYSIVTVEISGLFDIIDDEGDVISCVLDSCCHLEGLNWSIVA